jgi:NAD(P)H dehydrogenase (quinone)
LSLGNVFYHWGSLIVPPGYTDPVVYAAGGNPDGTSFAAGPPTGDGPDAAALNAARYQGRRLAQITIRLLAGRARHRCRRGRRERPGPRAGIASRAA